MALGKFKLALKDFETVSEVADPGFLIRGFKFIKMVQFVNFT